MKPRSLAATLVLTAAATVFAADPQVIPVWPDLQPVTTQGTDHADQRGDATRPNRFITDIRFPTLTVHPAPADKNTGAAVVICPGGGYRGVAVDKEGHEIARWLNGLGVNAVVLQYRMPRPAEWDPSTPPLPLLDAHRAIRIVRAKADEWKIDPKKVGILGFSAGGHLASTAATKFDAGTKDAADPLDRLSSRPDFVILGYPVISMHEGMVHGGSRRNLLGPAPDPKLEALYSSEDQVTAQTAPAFLFHAKDDKGVKIENSRAFRDACVKAGVPAELHEYNEGGHGFGLGKGDSTQWPAACEAWMRKLGLLERQGG